MSEQQRAVLREIYEHDPSPTMETRQHIAERTGMPTSKVTNWFRNLRQSVRKEKLRAQSQSQQRAQQQPDHSDTDEEDEEEDEEEVMTPFTSPSSKVEHSFSEPSTSPAIKSVELQEHPQMQDALLLLHFIHNCNLNLKSKGPTPVSVSSY